MYGDFCQFVSYLMCPENKSEKLCKQRVISEPESQSRCESYGLFLCIKFTLSPSPKSLGSLYVQGLSISLIVVHPQPSEVMN